MDRRNLTFIFVCAALAALMSMINFTRAQGLDQISLTGENVAAQLRQSSDDLPYNMKIGPVQIRVSADLTTAYNDNTNLAKTGAIADVVTTPAATISGHWAVSDLNTLDFNIGVGYQSYLDHSQYNDILLSPDSEARFNFFLGETEISLHDEFSYEQDPTQIGQLSNQTRLQRFQNDAGVTATWDLNPITVSLSYDHTNYEVINSIYNYLSNQGDSISPQVTYKINPTLSAGMSLSVSNTRYEQNVQNNSTTVQVGPFVQTQISKNLSVNAQAGGYIADYGSGGSNGDTSNVESYYGSLGLNHRINDYVQESLTAGKEYIPGLTSNTTQRIYATYTATWQATTNINVGGNLIYENLSDSGGTVQETSNRYGVGLNLNDNLTQHLTLTLNYQYLLKVANPENLGYTQNVGTVGIGYRF
jgi:hypothetical protein